MVFSSSERLQVWFHSPLKVIIEFKSLKAENNMANTEDEQSPMEVSEDISVNCIILISLLTVPIVFLIKTMQVKALRNWEQKLFRTLVSLAAFHVFSSQCKDILFF